MREVLGEASFEATNTVYNRTMVASELTLENLVKNIIPLTGWYRQIIQPIDTERTTRSAKKRSKRKSSRIGPRLPKLKRCGRTSFGTGPKLSIPRTSIVRPNSGTDRIPKKAWSTRGSCRC